MRGIKVLGHASMLRSSACPGLIVSTNHDAANAAFKARAHGELREQMLELQGRQIRELQDTLQMLLNAQSGGKTDG
ncbi:structural protein [Serratia phage 2050H1]|uniref:Structural protein n=1 Tax=Serratia phage 2050H1 TaxID=2024250 RepID=A0A249Y2B7_9CAUD|nr:structural protein [Serratia phage 2050H1]